MRAVIQRVTCAKVKVEAQIVGEIEKGLVVLLGVTHDDTPNDAQYLAEKIVALRIFDDTDGRMNDLPGATLLNPKLPNHFTNILLLLSASLSAKWKPEASAR